MIALAHAAVVLWVVLGVALFRAFPGRRTAIGLYVLGVLLLPELQAQAHVPDAPQPLGLPGLKLTKFNAIAYAVLLGSLLFDRGRWAGVRPRWFDLPVLAWCLSPAVSTVANAVFYDDPVSQHDPALLPAGVGRLGLAVSWLEYAGAYDALAQAADQLLTWGVPYWLGRVYLADPGGLRDLLVGVALGGLAYVPFCLAETRLSPQLHLWVYGFRQHDFLQSIRLGGFRPMVFMEHGLAVGLWMTAAALVAYWLWRAGPLRRLPLPGGATASGLWLVLPLAATAVLCKSSGALALGAAGFAALETSRLLRVPVLVAALALVAPAYAAVRATQAWDGREVVDAVAESFDEDRAASLAFRLRNEDMLVEKAVERPWVGWGAWGRSRVYDAHGNDMSVADGLWVIALGERGAFGLVALGLVLLLPVWRLLARHGTAPWARGGDGAAAAAAVVLVLYSIDCLMNAMVNPVFMLLAGGLATLPAGPAAAPPAPRPAWRVRAVG